MALYIDRLSNVITAAFINKVTLEFRSEPGIGKSSVITQTAADMAKKLKQPFGLAVRHLSTMDPTEVAGPLFITKRTLITANERIEQEMAVNSYPAVFPNDRDKVFLPDGTVTTVAKHGSVPRFGFVFLDELRQSAHDVQKPAARLLDEQAIGEWSLDMFGGVWSVIAASNRTEDNSGVNKDLAFITNRKCVLTVRSSPEILYNYLEAKGELHYMCLGYLKFAPGAVFSPVVPKDDKPFPTPRSFERACKMLMTMGKNGVPASDAEAVEVASGLIGEGRAPELCGYFRVHDELVKLEDIIADPAKCPLPERLDVMWATVQMMIYHADSKNVLKLFAYMERMPQDLQIPMVASICSKMPDLTHNRDYAAWCVKNQKLLMAAYAADRRFKTA